LKLNFLSKKEAPIWGSKFRGVWSPLGSIISDAVLAFIDLPTGKYLWCRTTVFGCGDCNLGNQVAAPLL
jgi:hypothetical protein